MNLLEELRARELVSDVTHEAALASLLTSERISHYAGHDPTATSLHVGHLVPIVIQARLQKAGHRPIALVGGATGMIGDPSGKSAERNLLDADTLAENVAAIGKQLGRFFDFDKGPAGAVLVNNIDWTRGISFIDFLRDTGKHMTVNYMLAKDSVRSRLEDRDQGISYTEFSYMLLQAYDYVHLAKHHGCRLQVGGSDQWGNITAGTELWRKLGNETQLFGLTAPLLTDSSGQKMGKTSTGQRVWLDADKTSPYAFYQYWLGATDADVGKFLKMFSWRPLAEIAEILSAHNIAPHDRLAQKALAEDFTHWVHGAVGVASAKAATAVMFGSSLDGIDDATLGALEADLPKGQVTSATLEAGLPVLDFLVQTELCKSKGDAKRLIANGGAYINNVRITDDKLVVTNAHRASPSFILLRSGKKEYRLVRVLAAA